MTHKQRIHLANRAKEVVENEAYVAAFATIETEIVEQWKAAPARDVEGRERLWLMQALLVKLKTTLESTMDSGKLAQADLRHKQTLAERTKDWLR